AIESFKEALKIRTDDSVIYFSMAEALMNIGENEQAKEALETAVIVDPDYADAYYNLAGVCAALGENASAREYLNKAVAYYRQQGENQKADHYEKLFKDFFRGVWKETHN
ncbi:MAG: tetratricopeptide repeat protein, partial [Candidatus Omnitrophica bacterium]|nr:tetratricopeptide repeat protein [Candidatus Omnitrophota bacterium]